MSDENCSYRTQILHVYIDIDVIYPAFILPSGKLTVRYWSRGYVKIVVLPIKNGDFQYQLCNNWPQGIKLSIISMMSSWWNLKYHLSSPVVKGVHPNPTTNQPTNGKRTSYSPVFDAPHHIHQYLMPLARLQLLQIFCSKGLPIGAFFLGKKSTGNHGFLPQNYGKIYLKPWFLPSNMKISGKALNQSNEVSSKLGGVQNETAPAERFPEVWNLDIVVLLCSIHWRNTKILFWNQNSS